MSTPNQQTLTDSGANERSPMLEKGNYIPWESRFRRFLDNKLEVGDRMWHSIEKGPYVRPMIPNPNKPTEQILEPLSKMTGGNKKQYIADVRVMKYLFQAILNDYNLVDACKNAKDMWERIKRLMFGSDVTNHVLGGDTDDMMGNPNPSSTINESDSEDYDEELDMVETQLPKVNDFKGASTLDTNVSNV
nr:hypothetical protein [Tanacetum cinerariifolium]